MYQRQGDYLKRFVMEAKLNWIICLRSSDAPSLEPDFTKTVSRCPKDALGVNRDEGTQLSTLRAFSVSCTSYAIILPPTVLDFVMYPYC